MFLEVALSVSSVDSYNYYSPLPLSLSASMKMCLCFKIFPMKIKFFFAKVNPKYGGLLHVFLAVASFSMEYGIKLLFTTCL